MDIKEAALLYKYYLAAMSLLDKKDTKAASMVNYPMLIKA